VEAPVIGRLDRYLALAFLRNLLLVVVVAVAILLALDVLFGLQLLMRRGEYGAWPVIQYFACRVPGYLGFALPTGAVIAALVVTAPMLRRGEFIALEVAGMSLRQATRALVVAALLTGLVDALIADAVAPAAMARSLAVEDLLQGQRREGRVWTVPERGSTWYAGGATLVGTPRPELRRVVAASPQRMAMAERLVWEGGRWQPAGPVLAWSLLEDGAHRLERAAALGDDLGLPVPPDELYRRLLPRYTMSGVQLIDRGERADLAQFAGRWARLLITPLAVLAALAAFVRFANRDRIIIGAVRGCLAALVPIAIITVATLAADATPGIPVLTVIGGVVVAATGVGIAAWRWRL
jgi:lipopolysaccharide export LptBFGC system permease protein LptF